MYVAIKMNCFSPRGTECRTYEYFQEIERLGSDWLVFDVSRFSVDAPHSHPQLAFDYDTGLHLSRPW